MICTAAFMTPFMGSALNLALPDISHDFSMKAVELTWLATAYLIASAIFQIPFARLADLIGRRKIFFWGIACFTLTSVLCGFATSGTMLIVFRFLNGICSAMIFGTNIAILSSLFPGKYRGKALGINTAVVYGALAIGPFFGGMLTHYLGWQSIFFFAGTVGLIILVLIPLFLKDEWIEAKGEKFDLTGSIIYGISLAAVIFGFSTLPELYGFICLGLGLIASIFFVMYEKRQEYPAFNVRLFSGNRIFTLSSLAALINYAATFAISFMLSLYLQYVRGLDAVSAGLILISQAIVQSAFSLIAGSLTTRFSSSGLATLGMTIIVVGLAGFILTLDVSTPFWLIITFLIFLGVGFGIFSSPNTNVIMGSVEKHFYSQASATTGTMRLTGQAISMGIAGMAISFLVGNKAITPKVYPAFMQSIHLTLIIFLVLCLVGIYFSSARNKK